MTFTERRQLVGKKAIEKIKALGYQVYGSGTPETTIMGYIRSKDGLRIGSFQVDEFAQGITFTTVHKPCRECGTGFRVQTDDHFVSIEELCEKHVEQSFLILPPWKPYQRDIQAAYREQYRDFREWLAYEKKHFPNIHQY